MEAIKLCRLDTPIIFIEARINLSRFVVTGCAAKTSATVTFPSLNLISLFRSEERFSRNAETDLVCRLLLEKKNARGQHVLRQHHTRSVQTDPSLHRNLVPDLENALLEREA